MSHTMPQLVVKVLSGNEVVMGAMLPVKEFSTGSEGYFATGKCLVDVDTYQFQVQLVRVDSDKEPEAAARVKRAAAAKAAKAAAKAARK